MSQLYKIKSCMEIRREEPLCLNSKSMLSKKKRKRRKRLLIYQLLFSRMPKVWLMQEVQMQLVHRKQSTSTQIQDKVPIICLRIQSLLARTSCWVLTMMTPSEIDSERILKISPLFLSKILTQQKQQLLFIELIYIIKLADTL